MGIQGLDHMCSKLYRKGETPPNTIVMIAVFQISHRSFPFVVSLNSFVVDSCVCVEAQSRCEALADWNSLL